MKMMKYVLLAITAFALTACGGDDKAASTATKEATAPAAMAESSMAADNEYGRTIDHSLDEVEFELRRSIGGLDRMIAQYTADGYATDELEAQKVEMSANLDALLGGG